MIGTLLAATMTVTMTSAQEKESQDWLRALMTAIDRNIAAQEPSAKQQACMVSLLLNDEGYIKKLTTEKCDGEYKEAVENGILRSQPLPLPKSRAVFDRNLKLLINK